MKAKWTVLFVALLVPAIQLLASERVASIRSAEPTAMQPSVQGASHANERRYWQVAAEDNYAQCVAQCKREFAECTKGTPNGLKPCLEKQTKCINSCK